MNYEGHQLKLVESRIEVPVSAKQKTYQLWYEEGSNCPYEDFEKSVHNNGFFKTIGIDQIKNAFWIRTFGLYKKFQIEVFPSKKRNQIQIATRNKMTASELGLNKLGEHWYKKEVDYSRLELVWEESIKIVYSKQKYGHIIRLAELMKIRMNN
jgi:hypothetical protein